MRSLNASRGVLQQWTDSFYEASFSHKVLCQKSRFESSPCSRSSTRRWASCQTSPALLWLLPQRRIAYWWSDQLLKLGRRKLRTGAHIGHTHTLRVPATAAPISPQHTLTWIFNNVLDKLLSAVLEAVNCESWTKAASLISQWANESAPEEERGPSDEEITRTCA